MISISGKNWEELTVNKRLVDKIKIDHNFNDVQAKIIISRNFTSEEIYSIKNKNYLINPFLKTKDFLLGCDLLKDHIDNKKNILIIGDYDVDGCVSTSIMFNFLKQSKSKVNYYIPDRFKDGYGADKRLVKILIKSYVPDLIIFLDCGSNSYDALTYIKSQKISSFVIDHHNISNPFPPSTVLINPKKNTNYKNYSYLCTAYLTYLFIDLYLKKNQSVYKIKDSQIYVLLATVADVMPIRELNRFLSINVLEKFDINKNFIFKTLFKTLNIKKKLEIDDLGFLIGPIFNSAGRIDNANQIVDLLTCSSINRKNIIIEKIFLLNHKRKLLEKRCLENIDFREISNQKGVLFIYKPDIPEGIIGIIASRIKDYFNKPCIVFTNSNKVVKGSARSTTNFNIGEYIKKSTQENITITGGGHNLAAGVTLLKSKINDFKKFIDNFYYLKKPSIINYYVSKLSLNSINKVFIDDIEILGPFGNANMKPIFLIENVKFIDTKIINDKFITCFVKTTSKKFKTVSFNNINTDISLEILNSKNSVDILVRFLQNNQNNKKSIQLELIDLLKKY